MQRCDTYTYPTGSNLLAQAHTSTYWCGTDSSDLYAINCQRRPPGWDWDSRPVTYTWNTEGYRAPEWQDVDWAQSHVVMGCSHVLGVGVDDADTLPSQLSGQLGEPVINLGLSGGSAHTVQYNTLRMTELGWRPRSVTIIIPQLTRLTYFDNNQVRHFTPAHLGSGVTEDLLSMYQLWITPGHNAGLHSRMATLGAEAIWQAQGVPVVLRHALKPITSDAMGPCLVRNVDYGRDFQCNERNEYYAHFGPATYAVWATSLAEAIRLL